MKTFKPICCLQTFILASLILLCSCSRAGSVSWPNDPDPVVKDTFPKDSNYIVPDTSKIIEGYLTPSKWYTYSWDDINYSNVTHIVYAFLRPVSAGDPTLTYGNASEEAAVYGLYPSLTDKTHLGYGDKLIAKAHTANVKVLIGIAGGVGRNAKDLDSIFANDSLRKQFIGNLITLCESRGYDGVTLDYEYPSSAAEGIGITNFAQELRIAFLESAVLAGKNMFITMAVPRGDWAGMYFDYGKLAKCCNWFSSMTYEFATSWTNRFSFNSPLYTSTSAGANTAIATTLHYLKDTRGINPLQIVIGAPFFGWVFSNYTSLGGTKSTTNGVDKRYTRIYNDYLKNSPTNGYVKYWNDTCKQSYLVNTSTNEMITYDDEQALMEKCNYIKTNGLKGVMIWEISRGFLPGTPDPNPLLTVLGSNLLY
ncbi:MAG: glycoside hydrolase family 18 protein [Niabella sp.]|nr:glycoside hydrolase family 18 protein [Niabella sp.]